MKLLQLFAMLKWKSRNCQRWLNFASKRQASMLHSLKIWSSSLKSVCQHVNLMRSKMPQNCELIWSESFKAIFEVYSFNCRFISDLILNGVIDSAGIQLLGSVLSFVLNTDKQEHVNVPIILPFCQANLFDCSGLVPLSCQKSAIESDLQTTDQLLSPRFNPDQRSAFGNLIKNYTKSLIDHLSNVRAKMNSILKSIKRQERTKGKKFVWKIVDNSLI